MYFLNYKPKYFYDASIWHHLDSAAFLSPVRHLIARHTLPCSHRRRVKMQIKVSSFFGFAYTIISQAHFIHIAASSAINQVTYLDLYRSIPTFTLKHNE